MPDKVAVNVLLTKQDYKQLFFALNKKHLIVYAVISGVMLVTVLFYLVSSVLLMFFSALTAVLFIFAFLIFCALFFLSSYLRYRRLTAVFRSEITPVTTLYEVDILGYTATGINGHLSMSWNDIVRIVEYRTMFVIVQSIGKISAIPKRCFYGPVDLNAFVGLLIAGVPPKKLKLKNHAFSGFSPDMPPPCEIKYGEIMEQMPQGPAEPPVFAFRAVMTKQDYLKYNYFHYYSNPGGIIMTALGLVLLAAAIWALGSHAELQVFSTAILLILGVWLLLGGPVLILIQGARIYKSDSTIRNATTEYLFYNDRIVVHNEKGSSTRRFGTFRRFAKTDRFYLLYIARNIAYVIPRRYIQDTAAFDAYFDFMKAENDRLKTNVSANPPQSSPQPQPFQPARFCDRCGAPRPSLEYAFCPECGKRYE